MQPVVKVDIDASDWQTDPIAPMKVGSKKNEIQMSMASLPQRCLFTLSWPPYPSEAM